MGQLEKAILKTINYGQKFGVKYGHGEIKERLISKNKYADKEIDNKLRSMKIVNVKNDKTEIFLAKVKIARNLGEQLVNKFPNILMIGITGSVAAAYPKKSEDIDLIIIVKKENLWITRLGVKIWAWINKIPQRKYKVAQTNNEFCFNLWLEEGALRLPRDRQNLKNAMDLILMKPVVNKDNIYEKFIKKNEWAKKYVAGGYNRKILNSKIKKLKIFNKTSSGKMILNWLAYWGQYIYMRNKISEETIDIKRAFFHPQKNK